MIPGRTHQEISDNNERIAEECFKRMGLKPIRLDVRGRRQKTKRPDFQVNGASDKPVVICEVKTILSAGQSKERPGVLISALDPKLYEKAATGFVYDIDLRDMEAGMSSAGRKYRALLKDRPDLEGVPLVVVFFSDFYANHFDIYDRRDLEQFPVIAGILRAIEDRAINEETRGMSGEKLESWLREGRLTALQPSTKQLRLVENKWAKPKLSRDFVESCVT